MLNFRPHTHAPRLCVVWILWAAGVLNNGLEQPKVFPRLPAQELRAAAIGAADLRGVCMCDLRNWILSRS